MTKNVITVICLSFAVMYCFMAGNEELVDSYIGTTGHILVDIIPLIFVGYVVFLHKKLTKNS